MALLSLSSAFLLLAGILLAEGIAPLHKTVEKVADSYIVKIKDNYDVDVVAQQLEDHVIIRRSGGRLTHRYRRSIRGFAAYLPAEEAVNLVLNHEAVEYVQENGIVRVTSTDWAPQASSTTSQKTSSYVPWNLDRIDQADLPLDGRYDPSNNGDDVMVYVLDSGVLPTHTEFGQRASACYDATGGTGIDCLGHGTYVAGIVAGETYGVASKVQVCGVRVVGAGCDTEGTVDDVLAGIDWVVHHASTPAVVTLSLNMYGDHFPLSHALEGLIDQTGATVVVAAGNMDDDACNTSPAGNQQVITVGASGVDDVRWPSSNWGSCVDIFAPGVEVKSADQSGVSDTTVLSGTSVACPHVAGAAAILLAQDPSLTHASVKDRIVATGTPNVLQFNMSNTTETIEATDNLLLRVQAVGAPSDVTEHPEQTDLNIEQQMPYILVQNVDPYQIEPYQ